MHRGRLTCVVLATALLALVASAAAGATSFGLPLGTIPFNVAPAYPYDCSVIYNPFLGQPLTFPDPSGTRGASSCIWIHVPTPAEYQAAGGRNISLEPPGTGTVTQVQVRVGARTGPMQVVVMRALYQNTITPGRPNDACCFPVARSRTFTPRPNAITTVPVRLPVKEDATPAADDITTIADFDTLGLAVLSPGVPVPLYYTGDSSQPADFVWNTSSPSTATPGFSTDTGGFFVAMNGEWSGADPVSFGNGVAQVRGGDASVPVRCAASASCIGQLLLQSGALGAPRLAAARAAPVGVSAKKPTTYGSTSFKIGAGKHKSVSVHLNRTGRQLVTKHHATKVWANVRIRGASFASRITLRR